jgi:DNA-binding transcriptional regulator YiaG
MKLTTNHPPSSSGTPVFLDDSGNPLGYAMAIRLMCKSKGWTYQDLADKTGYSRRTAEGWGQGRIPPKPALRLLSLYL